MKHRKWNARGVRALRRFYPHVQTSVLAKRFGRPVHQVYAKARKLGLAKSAAFFAGANSGRIAKGDPRGVGASGRYPKGHVPANKGLRRPGYAPGRMRQTMFKKGQWPRNKDPEFYVVGALRVNADGYIDMRTSFKPGAMGWTGLHRILWQDAHGPIPKGFVVRFKNGDKLDCCLENLELVSLADNCRRNSIHNLPPKLKTVIQLRGVLNRRINKLTEGSDDGTHA